MPGSPLSSQPASPSEWSNWLPPYTKGSQYSLAELSSLLLCRGLIHNNNKRNIILIPGVRAGVFDLRGHQPLGTISFHAGAFNECPSHLCQLPAGLKAHPFLGQFDWSFAAAFVLGLPRQNIPTVHESTWAQRTTDGRPR